MPRSSWLVLALLAAGARADAEALDAPGEALLQVPLGSLSGPQAPGELATSAQDKAVDQAEMARHFAGAWIPKVQNASDPDSWSQAFRERYGGKQHSGSAGAEQRERLEGGQPAALTAFQSADNCKSLEELQQWRQQELAKVLVLVPPALQPDAKAGVEFEFLRQAERINTKQALAPAEPAGPAVLREPAEAAEAAEPSEAAPEAAALETELAAEGPADSQAAAAGEDLKHSKTEPAVASLAAAAPSPRRHGTLLAVLLAAIAMATAFSVALSPACQRRRVHTLAGQDDYIYLMEP